MREIGVRDLRDHLSRYLAEARQGRSLTITDHGKPVAKLIPTGPSSLERLIADGTVTPARAARSEPPPPIETTGTVSDLVAGQRR